MKKGINKFISFAVLTAMFTVLTATPVLAAEPDRADTETISELDKLMDEIEELEDLLEEE